MSSSLINRLISAAVDTVREWGPPIGLVGIGNVIQQGSSFVATVLVARELGPAEFGLFSFIQSTVFFLGVFSGFGLSVSLTISLAKQRVFDKAAAGAAIGNCLTLATAFSVITGVVAAYVGLTNPQLLGWKNLSFWALLSGITFLLTYAFSSMVIGAASGFEAYAALARCAAIKGLASIPLMTISAKWGGAPGAITGATLATAIATVDLAIQIKKICRSEGIVIRTTLPSAIRELLFDSALPLFLASMLSVPVAWYCNKMLVAAESGPEELGIFSASSQFRAVLAFVPAVVGQVLLPKVAQLRPSNRSNRPNGGGLFLTVIFSCTVALSLGGLLIICEPLLMNMFGPKFGGRSELFQLVILIGIVFSVQAPLSNALIAAGRLWSNVGIVLLGAAIQAFVAKLQIQRGVLAEGLALAYIASYAAQTAILLIWLIQFCWGIGASVSKAPAESG